MEQRPFLYPLKSYGLLRHTAKSEIVDGMLSLTIVVYSPSVMLKLSNTKNQVDVTQKNKMSEERLSRQPFLFYNGPEQ